VRTAPLLMSHRGLFPRIGVHRWPTRELGWYLDHCLANQDRHRVEVARVALQPQPLRLQRQRAPTGEGVVERGQPLPVEQFFGPWVVDILGASAPPALPDLIA